LRITSKSATLTKSSERKDFELEKGNNFNQVSISSTFYLQLLNAQIPKAQKIIVNLSVFFTLLGYLHVKDACKMLVKSTPDVKWYPNQALLEIQSMFFHSKYIFLCLNVFEVIQSDFIVFEVIWLRVIPFEDSPIQSNSFRSVPIRSHYVH